MTWFKVDDSFHSHPKVMATDPAALGLWVVAGSWCGSNLTDGFVPDHVLPRLLPGAVKLASKLVEAGLWSRAENGYQFHDWHDRNPTAEKVKADREASAERQKKWRQSKRNGHSNGVTNGVTNAAPSRPDPPPSGERVGGRKSPAKPRLIHSWCGECDEQSRMVERDDGRLARCPRCSSRSVS